MSEHVELPVRGGAKMLCDEGDAHLFSGVALYPSSNGAPVAHVSKIVYVKAGSGSRGRMAHRVITNAPPGVWVDHINGDGMDNRRSNLRLCSPSQNIAAKRNVPNKTGFRGVASRCDGRGFTAYIRHMYVKLHLGCFDTAEAAARAYDAKALELFGAFARPNFPR